MNDLIAHYWWLPFLTVPAVALLIRHAFRRAGWADELQASLRRKLSAFPFSHPEHWVVTATTRDGRRFSRVVISSRFRLASQGVAPFALREIEDVAWEGVVGSAPGPVIQLSDGPPGAA